MKNKMILKQLTSGEIMFNYGVEFPTLQQLPVCGEYIVLEEDNKPAAIFKYARMDVSKIHLMESIFTTKSELPARELRALLSGGPKAFSVILVLPLSLTIESTEPSGSICGVGGESGYKGISDALILSDGHHFSFEDIDRLLDGAEGRNVAVCYSKEVNRNKVLRHLAENHNYCVAKHIYQF